MPHSGEFRWAAAEVTFVPGGAAATCALEAAPPADDKGESLDLLKPVALLPGTLRLERPSKHVCTQDAALYDPNKQN